MDAMVRLMEKRISSGFLAIQLPIFLYGQKHRSETNFLCALLPPIAMQRLLRFSTTDSFELRKYLLNEALTTLGGNHGATVSTIARLLEQPSKFSLLLFTKAIQMKTLQFRGAIPAGLVVFSQLNPTGDLNLWESAKLFAQIAQKGSVWQVPLQFHLESHGQVTSYPPWMRPVRRWFLMISSETLHQRWWNPMAWTYGRS